ncbi:hypothetical protein RFI_10423, partial [Reticulomyxa filosa]
CESDCNFSENSAVNYGGIAFVVYLLYVISVCLSFLNKKKKKKNIYIYIHIYLYIITDYTVVIIDSTLDGNCWNGDRLCAAQGGLLSASTYKKNGVSGLILERVTMRRGTSGVGGAMLLRHGTENSTLNVSLTNVTFEQNNATRLTSSSDIALFQNAENPFHLQFHPPLMGQSLKAVSWPTQIRFQVSPVDYTCPNCPMYASLQTVDYFNQSYVPFEYCDIDGVCSFIQLQLLCVTAFSSLSCPIIQQTTYGQFAHGLGNITFVVTPGKLGENVAISLTCDNELTGSVCPLSSVLRAPENTFHVAFVGCSREIENKIVVNEANDECVELSNVLSFFLIFIYPTNNFFFFFLSLSLLTIQKNTIPNVIACCCAKLYFKGIGPFHRFDTLPLSILRKFALLYKKNFIQFWKLSFYSNNAGNENNEIKRPKQIWLMLAMLSTVFLLISWTANLVQTYSMSKTSRFYLGYNSYSRKMYASRLWLIMILVGCCGDLFVTLVLMNSRIFGLEVFSLGMTWPEIRKLTQFKALSIVLLENTPQIVLQLIGLNYSKANTRTDINRSVYLSFTLSLLSIAGTVISLWIRKQNLFMKYSFQLDIQLNLNGIANFKKRVLLQQHIQDHLQRFETIAETIAHSLEHLHKQHISIGSATFDSLTNSITIYGNILIPYGSISQWLDSVTTVPNSHPTKDTINPPAIRNYSEKFGMLFNSKKLLFSAEFKIFEIDYSVHSKPICLPPLAPEHALSESHERESSQTSNFELFYDELKSLYGR